MKYPIKIILLVFLAITSCKSKKTVSEANSIEIVSAKKLIGDHYEHSFNKETIDAKLNANYEDSKAQVSLSVKMRVEKDKAIWLSATKLGFPVAKMLITPTQVSFYEKLDKTYFDGDFSLLSNWLGTELDFEKVQNLLVGQAILNLKDGKYDVKVVNKSFELKPRKTNDLFAILFFMNKENYKLDKQEISNSTKEQLLTISYPNYKEMEGEQFPEAIDIKVLDKKKITAITLEYKSVEFDKPLTFPFEIPEGYKQISLK
jgi:hypothetical protein